MKNSRTMNNRANFMLPLLENFITLCFSREAVKQGVMFNRLNSLFNQC